MEIKSKIIKEIPLVEKVDAQLEVYLVDKKRYVVFWEDIINKKNMMDVLEHLTRLTSTSAFSEWKTLIIVGRTKDEFKKGDLFFFDNVSTFAVFYLIDEETGKIYMDDSLIFTIGLNYRKVVRKINKILTGQEKIKNGQAIFNQ
ncbi:MAG: hypothetical protein IKD20_06685 [Clostridia bacterium]|nr:hypothetical protein [Clostridia bacterium]